MRRHTPNFQNHSSFFITTACDVRLCFQQSKKLVVHTKFGVNSKLPLKLISFLRISLPGRTSESTAFSRVKPPQFIFNPFSGYFFVLIAQLTSQLYHICLRLVKRKY